MKQGRATVSGQLDQKREPIPHAVNPKAVSQIDFERAKLLMDIVVSAGQHGPMYQHLASEAGKELKEMIEKDKNAPKVVTPPDGPENSAIGNADGTYTRIPPAPIRNAQETDVEWQARYDAFQKQFGKMPQTPEQSHTDPRANERGIGDTRTREQLEAGKQAAIDQEQKPKPPSTKPVEEQPHETSITRRV